MEADRVVQELRKEGWPLSLEKEEALKVVLAHYALAALHDSAIADEAFAIVDKESKDGRRRETVAHVLPLASEYDSIIKALRSIRVATDFIQEKFEKAC